MTASNEPFAYTMGVRVPGNVNRIAVDPSVKAIPPEAFAGLDQLKEVVLPEGLLQIGHSAFYDCIALERINFPLTLIKIEGFAFYCCEELKEVALPEGFLEIGKGAFLGCSLKHINCPSSLTRIGMAAFFNCRSLAEVKMMGGIVTVEKDAFSDCDLLKQFAIPFKAFVITECEHYLHINSRLATYGTVAHTDDEWVMIAPEHMKSVSLSNLMEITNTIQKIMNDKRSINDRIKRVCALISHYAQVEISTILELKLWEIKMSKIDDLNPETRVVSRITCGVDFIVPCVMDYL